MSRTKKIKVIETKLKRLNAEIKVSMPKRFNEDGRVNTEITMKVQLKYNEVYFLERKLEFLNQGKSRLGEVFGEVALPKQ